MVLLAGDTQQYSQSMDLYRTQPGPAEIAQEITPSKADRRYVRVRA